MTPLEQQMLAVLRAVEWSADRSHPTLGHDIPACPLCHGRGDRKYHYPFCKLKDALVAGEAAEASKSAPQPTPGVKEADHDCG